MSLSNTHKDLWLMPMDICHPPREKGRNSKIFKIDFYGWYDSRDLSVSITERIFDKYSYRLVLSDLYYFKISYVINKFKFQMTS